MRAVFINQVTTSILKNRDIIWQSKFDSAVAINAMDKSLRDISNHMKGLGLGALQHSNWHANYMSHENEWWSELSVLQAAHSAEILIKARIAEEHPLLIFDKLPKSDGKVLGFEALLQKSTTIMFSELPDRLWATTGIVLDNIEVFHEFGKLRNSIQHFASPNGIDLGKKSLEFNFKVIDPFINKCWGLFAIDYNEDYERFEYLVDGLVRSEIEFLISPSLIEELKELEHYLSNSSSRYKETMLKRFKNAKSEHYR